jgi:hypothetical protein
MLGSVDCMHWEWRNCPSAWKGMFIGHGKHPSMILEAVVSAFRPRGVPGLTSKLSLRVPAQMGRRETEHKGEKQ